MTSIHTASTFIKARIKSIDYLHKVHSTADAQFHVTKQYLCTCLWFVELLVLFLFIRTSFCRFRSVKVYHPLLLQNKQQFLLTAVQLQHLPPKRIATSPQFSDLETWLRLLNFTFQSSQNEKLKWFEIFSRALALTCVQDILHISLLS